MTYSVLKVPLNPNQPTNQFSSVTGSPGWSRKKGHKTVVVSCGDGVTSSKAL